MNITAWSPGRRYGGVTANLVAISTCCSSIYDVSVGLRSNHFSEHMMEDYFSVTSMSGPIVDGKVFFSGWGSPDYIKYLLTYKDKYEQQLYRGHMAVGCKGKVSLYAPQDPYEDRPFFTGANDDLFMIDASGENNYATFDALDHADLRMIFLPGDIDEAIHQFEPYKEYSNRAIFLFNKRNAREKTSVIDFMKTFDVPRSNLFTIPYCRELESACIRGDVDLLTLSRIDSERSEYGHKIGVISKKLVALDAYAKNHKTFR